MEILRMGYPLSIDILYTGIIYLYIISLRSKSYLSIKYESYERRCRKSEFIMRNKRNKPQRKS